MQPSSLPIVIVLLAAAVNLAFWLWYRQKRQRAPHRQDPPGDEITLFGSYSPVLTTAARLWRQARLVIKDEFNLPPPGPAPSDDEGIAFEPAPVTSRKVAIIPTLILIAAAIPPLLVVIDRWFGSWVIRLPVEHFACNKLLVYCNQRYPEYFAVIILPLMILLAVGMAAATRYFPFRLRLNRFAGLEEGSPVPAARQSLRGRVAAALIWLGAAGMLISNLVHLFTYTLPHIDLILAVTTFVAGLSLRELPLNRFVRFFALRRRWLFPFLVFHLAILALADYYYSAANPAPVIFLALFAVILATLPRLKNFSPILWVFTLSLVVCIININAWWLSAIGDEYEFYHWAGLIAHQQPLSTVIANLFSYNGPYATHPYFSSVLQAGSLLLFGDHSFGWRISSLYLGSLSILFFYLFFKTFLHKRIALFACALLAGSHYLIIFSKLGYNNLQALFALSLVLWTGALAARKRSLLAFASLGLAIAFCFYVYPAALYAIPVGLLLVFIYHPPTSRQSAACWGVMLFTALALIFPLFLQPQYWAGKVEGLFINESSFRTSLWLVLNHFTSNFISAFQSFLYTTEEGHFVVSSFLDPISGVLFIIGFIYLLRYLFKDRFIFFMICGYLAMLFFAGASHDRQNPPTTRMFMILPWLTAFTAFGFFWLLSWLKGTTNSARLSKILPVAALLIIVPLNFFQANYFSLHRFLGFQTPETVFLRVLIKAQSVFPGQAQTFIYITDPTWTSAGFKLLPQVYPLLANIDEVVVTGQTIPAEDHALLRRPDTFVIIKPWGEPDWMQAMQSQLTTLGKLPCDIHRTDNFTLFQLWYSPGYDGLCDPPSP